MGTSLDAVARVRAFNRFYTRRIGVLTEHLLASEWSLTEMRVLYEIAHRDAPSAASIAEDLGLDRGYLSRILKHLHRQGMIGRAAAPDDGRKSLLSLTARGRRTFHALEARTDEEVSALIASASPQEQARLLRAMRDVEEVLSPRAEGRAAVVLRDPRPGEIGWIVHRHGALYWQEYRYDWRFEALVARIAGEFVEKLDAARERCWVAEREGEVVGSVFLVRHSGAAAKLRLLYVEPSARGQGIGERLVAECVRFARGAGYRKITLWTQSELLAARKLYQKAGFTLVNAEPHASFGRGDLVSETWELAL